MAVVILILNLLTMKNNLEAKQQHLKEIEVLFGSLDTLLKECHVSNRTHFKTRYKQNQKINPFIEYILKQKIEILGYKKLFNVNN